MLGGLFSRWVDSAHHSREKWLVSGMPGPMIERSKQNKNNCKQNSPRFDVSWRHPLFRASHGLMIVGGGEVRTLLFYLGTAYNVCSMWRCPGLRGTHHIVSRSVRLGRGPPWPYTRGPVRTVAAYKEDSTRLGDQDKDSSPSAYSTRTLVILGLW